MLGWLVTLLLAITTPCAAEDGPAPCYWDGTTRGNGVGSLVLILEDR
jgi:hypothetical protein